MKFDLRSLVLYTKLPLLWECYRHIVNVSPVTESGYSLTGAASYFLGMKPIAVPHKVFWDVCNFFLLRENEDFREKQKRAIKKQNRKK